METKRLGLALQLVTLIVLVVIAWQLTVLIGKVDEGSTMTWLICASTTHGPCLYHP